ncbi:hypothetical protein, partial [Gluconobacter cerinus]
RLVSQPRKRLPSEYSQSGDCRCHAPRGHGVGSRTLSSRGKSQKADTADQDVKEAQSQVAQQQVMDQRGADAPQTVDELLDALDKGKA